MTDVLVQGLSQWGTAGIIALAAGYVLWDSWKKNKENDKWVREQMFTAHESREKNSTSLTEISTSIREFREEHTTWRKEITQRVEAIESKIDKHHPDIDDMEAARLKAITCIAPALHQYLAAGINTCKCDHIAMALLHNGSCNLSGIPYIKFDIIAEQFRPIHHPEDSDLISRYKDVDITTHNKLPMAIMQNPQVWFDINEESPLIDIDIITYRRCMERGIKKIAFQAIRDNKHMPTGFLVIYKFDDDPFDMEQLRITVDAIERSYLDVMDSITH